MSTKKDRLRKTSRGQKKKASPFLDRIEGKLAIVVVDGVEKTISTDHLPAGAKEGVYLTEDLRGIDEDETRESEKETGELRAKLEKEDDGGDFSI